MGRIQTVGSIPLGGETAVQGSKNGALPLIAASVLHAGRTVIHGCPRILDVEYMCGILRESGCSVYREKEALVIDAAGLSKVCISERYATKLRASVLLMGSLLGRCGRAYLPYPGGCTIGMRPIDFHLQAFQRMGARLIPDEKGIALSAEEMRGTHIELAFPSVGATENILLGAVMARGETVISGCAAEPEVEELCRFLNARGARIEGIGSNTLTVTGVDCLRDIEYRLMPDRIVAGTYLLAAAGTRGRITLWNTPVAQMEAITGLLREMGADVSAHDGALRMDASQLDKAPEIVSTSPYPGFPTDLQSQMMALLCTVEGESIIEENLFESRFLAAGELRKMGASIEIKGRRAFVRGVPSLYGACVRGRELRGGAALVAAGLAARGTTVIEGRGFIDRGYENIVRDLLELGANICEIT
ncbi:MAG: UDP-N-acetylglucosamine 1-carboxyvinyltransferase [Eubacteriales bacterium]|nr:UDP-N-acetylglucosamine 1-carboxyvinyltransferase [Eubacteriales bacterium]